MSIFATNLTATYDHSIARLRLIVLTDVRAERILAAATAAICLVTGESSEIVEDDIRFRARGSQATARHAIKLVCSALQAVTSAYTQTCSMGGAGEGLESAAPVLDCRRGQAIAESILIASVTP